MKVSRHAMRMLCILFSLCLMVSCLSLTAAAADGGACEADGCNGTYTNGFCSESGSHYEAAPAVDGIYKISNGGQLYWFAKLVDGGQTDANAELTCNITINEGVLVDGELNEDAADDFRSWNPIGSNKNKYTGAFNGCGYIISGLYYDRTSTLGTYVGLFATLGENGSVYGVTVADSYILAASNAGAIAGSNMGGTIASCTNASVIYTEGSDVGGIVGTNDGQVVACMNLGTVLCENENSGGIAGYNFGTILRCGNEGLVSNEDNKNESYVGGITGWNYNGSVISCYNAGELVNDGKYTGGLVAAAYDGLIQNCHNAFESGEILGGHYSMPEIVDCWYLADSDTDAYAGTAVKSAEQFASGELCYQLNGSTSEGVLIWHQTLGTDAYPVYHGAVVFYGYESCAEDAKLVYTNHDEPSHSWVGNHYCTVCGAINGECTDENADHICDYCNEEVSKCADGDNDHNCDVCGEELSKCADDDTDHACDICGGEMGKHEAAEGSHICGYCGEAASECADEDNDHLCDVCGEILSVCADEIADHKCDICGEILSVCLDEDEDGSCDICGANLSCLRDESCVLYVFSDVDRNEWYHDALHFCVAEGLMKGDVGGTFRPLEPITRAEMAQILYNIEDGEPVETDKSFSDVDEDDWYYAPVMWAAENGFVKGDTEGTYRPEDKITREEMVTIMWRYFGSEEPKNAELAFADAGDEYDWATAPIAWAVEHGYVKGTDGNRFAPKDNTLRCEIAQVMFNIYGK